MFDFDFLLFWFIGIFLSIFSPTKTSRTRTKLTSTVARTIKSIAHIAFLQCVLNCNNVQIIIIIIIRYIFFLFPSSFFLQPIGPKRTQLSELWAVKKKKLKYFQVWQITCQASWNVIQFFPALACVHCFYMVELRTSLRGLLPFSFHPNWCSLKPSQVCNHACLHTSSCSSDCLCEFHHLTVPFIVT